jgi:serine/threonine protein kinase, bacterial
MPLRIGETFAGYRILRLLGSGGMGEVYVVQHPRLPRHDALKVLRPDVSSDTSFRERFVREADLAAGLRHPHIVGIHDRGEYNGQLWIAMDYIEGTDAAQLVQQRYPAGMPAELAVPIITAVASALDYAHKKSLLHRDVKPANIIVADLDSDDRRVFLADFGIARPLDDTSGITTTNMTVGTVAYAAPEQLMGEQLDGRADQYALAATAYHLLTGSQLFPHSNPAVVISRHLNTPPPAIADSCPDIAGLDSVLAVALAKDPEKRFARCADFARALGEYTTTVSAPSPLAVTMSAHVPRGPRPTPAQSSAERPPAPLAAPINSSRRRWLIPAAILSVALLACAIGLIWQPWRKGPSSAMTQSAPSTSASPTQSAAPPPVSPPLLTATTTTDPARTPEPGLVNNANDPCSWCDTPNVKFFQSPSGNISCEIDYQRGYGMTDTAYCDSGRPPQNVSMNSDGVLTVCTAGESCLSNGPVGEPTLPYNHTTGIGPFTCLSEVSGVTCTVVSGRGFAISNSGITPVG